MTRLGLPRLVGLLGCLGLVAACGDSPTTPTSTITSPETESYSTLVVPRGTSSYLFKTHGRGTVSATLSSTTPGSASVGFGIGIPKSNGSGCNLNSSIVTGAGASPQLAVTAEVGDYCVQVFDPGTLTDSVAFTVSITHP
jgi:hypothetical protein